MNNSSDKRQFINTSVPPLQILDMPTATHHACGDGIVDVKG